MQGARRVLALGNGCFEVGCLLVVRHSLRPLRRVLAAGGWRCNDFVWSMLVGSRTTDQARLRGNQVSK